MFACIRLNVLLMFQLERSWLEPTVVYAEWVRATVVADVCGV